MQNKYRAVMYGRHNTTNLTIITEPMKSESDAERLLDGMRELGKCTGGHIEELIQLQGRQPEWVVE